MPQLSPKAVIVEAKVIMMERSRLPPRRCVHMLEAPPPGTQPPMKIPILYKGWSLNNVIPKPKAIC